MTKSILKLLMSMLVLSGLLLSVSCDVEPEEEEKETRESIIGSWLITVTRGEVYTPAHYGDNEFVRYNLPDDVEGDADIVVPSEINPGEEAIGTKNFTYKATVKTIETVKQNINSLIDTNTYRLVVKGDDMEWYLDSHSTTDPYYVFEKYTPPPAE